MNAQLFRVTAQLLAGSSFRRPLLLPCGCPTAPELVRPFRSSTAVQMGRRSAKIAGRKVKSASRKILLTLFVDWLWQQQRALADT